MRNAGDHRVQTLYNGIRNKICLLEYPPGMALKEEALASEYGVSRTPIRQVLQRLEYDGLVSNQSGAGVIVTTVDIRSLKEVYALRLKIAEFVGDMMSPAFPEDDLMLLEGIVKKVTAIRDNPDILALGRLYNDFNDIMTRNISNRSLRQICDLLFHQTARVWLELLPDFDWDDEVAIMLDELSDVIDGVRKGDMSTVGAVRRDHMVRLLHRINSYLGSADMS
jgi:DNA-binding GntR family transcriptional regulator